MSGLASSGPKEPRYSPSGVFAGAVNQVSPVPDVWMPKSVPLRAITVTTVEPGMPAAAPVVQLAGRHHEVQEEVVVAGRRTSPPPRRRPSAKPESIIAGSTSRRNISVPARLRLCPSSPICTIWAMIAFTSIGPAARTACCSSGPEHVGHPVQPLDDLGAVGAVPQHLAEPLVERAPRLVAGRLVAQAEHPHRRRDDAGHRADRAAASGRAPSSRRHPPPAAGVASSAVAAIPSNSIAPMSAPRIGPDARSQSTGGPACRNSPRPSPSASDAGTYVDQVRLRGEHPAQRLGVGGDPAGIAPSRQPATPGRRRAAATGRRETSTACRVRASASREAPAVTTAGGVERSHAVAPGEQVEGAPGGGRVGQEHPGAGRVERGHLGAEALRVVRGCRRRRRRRAGRRRGRGAGRAPARRRGRRPTRARARRRAGPRRVVGSSTSARSRSTRMEPSIIGCGRPWVSRSSPKSTIV